MIFRPHIPTIIGPRTGGGPNTGNQTKLTSVLHPIARICDLGLIDATNQRDYFLYHPYDGTLERLILSGFPETDVTDFSVQVIQTQGASTVTAASIRNLSKISMTPVDLAVPANLGEGPVFLRVKSVAIADTDLFATIHVQTSEIR